jgi:hypothetical protein
MDMRTIAVLLVTFSAGCFASTATTIASMYSVLETGESVFDGTKWVKVKSIWCDPITFDLYQDSNLAKENLASLEINIGGTYSIQSGKSLHLNIDGAFEDLTTLERITNIETKPGYYSSSFRSGLSFYLPSYNISSKRYIVEISLLERMANAEKLVMRIDLARDYKDAVCTNEKNSGSSVPAASTSYGVQRFLENMIHAKEP